MKRTTWIFLAALAAGTFFYVSFLFNFATTLTDWSGFGSSATLQLFHNFLHGRAYQSSLCASPGTGESVGFIANPHAFIHYDVIHIHRTAYLFAWFWALRPTPATLYGLIFAWNLLGGAWFTVSILRRGASRQWRDRAGLAGAVLAFGGLLSVACQMAQPLLFTGPLMLAVYDAFLARRRLLFLFWIAALALVSEDAAMVAVCFGAYLFLFEEEGRPYGVAAAALAIPYLLLLLFLIQPAARAELTTTASSTAAFISKFLFSLNFNALIENLHSMMPIAPFVPAFLLAGACFGVPGRKDLWKVLGLALLPAFPHWGECVVVGSAHHLITPWFGLYLALLYWLRQERVLSERPARWTLVWAAAFFAISLRVSAGHLPMAVKPWLYRRVGKTAKAELLERSLAGGESSNRAVIAAARALAPDRSLVFLTNCGVVGYIVSRSDVWSFPDYFDRADVLLIQKDAADAGFVFEPKPGVVLKELLARTPPGSARGRAVTPGMVQAIWDALVGGGTHRVLGENEHVLLLERKERRPFENPPTTYGWGWLRNVGRRPARA